MRYIKKGIEPAALTQWKAKQNAKAPQNLNFERLETEIKKQLLRQMLVEQGFLCAYTMHRIQNEDDCHIEHIQAQSTHQTLDLNYANMLACAPSGRPGTPNLGYGATYRKNRPIESPPTTPNIQLRIAYTKSGEITASNPQDLAIIRTLGEEGLNLNDDALIDLRKAALAAVKLIPRQAELRRPKQLLLAKDANKLVREAMQFDSEGRLMPFCMLIAHIASNHADKEAKRQESIRAQHRVLK